MPPRRRARMSTEPTRRNKQDTSPLPPLDQGIMEEVERRSAGRPHQLTMYAARVLDTLPLELREALLANFQGKNPAHIPENPQAANMLLGQTIVAYSLQMAAENPPEK